jgi:hypothetical protein
MVRSRWIKAVMATLAAGGMVWGQSAAPTSPKPPDDPTGRVVTVQEAGKPAQKCRVVKWWLDEKGNKVWQVEALDTHEMMTIIAGGPPVACETGQGRSIRTTIFHWRDHSPPPGAPVCPCDCGPAVAGTPCPPCDAPKVPDKKVVVEAPLPKIEVLPKAEPKKADPLLGDATQYAKKPLEQKLPPKGDPSAGAPLDGGGKSVADAGVGYRPLPVMTLPPYNVAPPSPHWQVPQAPQPIVNPGRGNAPEAHQGGIYYNAFTPSELVPPKPGTPEQAALGNAFSSDLDCCVTQGPPGLPAGGVYGPPGPPRSLVMAPANPRPAGALPASTPYGPVVQLTAPNPAGQGTQQPAAPPAPPSPVLPASYQAPTTTAAGQTPQQLMATLHDALYPSQREGAAERLSALDGKPSDAAVQALTQAVREDPAASVRAACVHALAKMKANTPAVIGALQAAKGDADSRVRSEAEEALSVLAPKGTAPATTPATLPQAVQPVSAVSPAPLPPAPAPAAGANPALPPLK